MSSHGPGGFLLFDEPLASEKPSSCSTSPIHEVNVLLCAPLLLSPQGSGQAAMRWSGDPQHYPFAGSSNVFWNIWASTIPTQFNYVGGLDPVSSRQRLDMYSMRRMTKLPVMSRPAAIQGYAQVVVDMPLDSQIPPIREVRVRVVVVVVGGLK